jgi:hypothetical protein
MRTGALHRRPLLRLALAACCLILSDGATAIAEPWEFRISRLRGRLDNPAGDNLWRIGDVNGNGTIDNDEQVGQYFELDRTLHETPAPLQMINFSYTVYAFTPNLLLGFRDYGGPFVDAEGPVQVHHEGPKQDDLVESIGVAGVPFIYFVDYALTVNAMVPAPSVVETASYARSSSVQIMYGLEFGSSPTPESLTTDDSFEIAAGARVFNMLDRSVVSTKSITDVRTDSTLDSESLGPQVAVGWTRRRGRLETHVGAAASIAYMQADGRQQVQFTSGLIPGGFNNPLLLTTTMLENSRQDADFLPMAEAAAQASYDLFPSVVCFARCDALYFGDMRQARDAIIFSFPQMGLADRGGSDVATMIGTLGVEWRR